jgi:hypothetical protein
MNVVKEIVMKRINEIKPYFRNSRNNEKTVELLVKLIPQVGFNVPILLDQKGVIVKGHARFKAAIKLGMEEVPCVITNADEETTKLDRIADNKVGEFTEWLTEGLTFEIDSLNADKTILEDLGLKVFDFSTPVAQWEDDKPTAEGTAERFKQHIAQNGPTVTEADIKQAEVQQQQNAAAPKVYAKVLCEKCGHIMFISENFIKFEYNN